MNKSRYLACGLALAMALLTSCSTETPTPTSTEATGSLGNGLTVTFLRSDPSSSLTESPVRAQAAAADNLAPQVVFKVQPAPNADRLIAGNTPFDVEFNACRSVDPEGDRLLFTIDADGDGRLEESGTHGGNCRLTFTYTAEQGQLRNLSPTICVVDLDAAGQPQRSPECRTYAVQVAGLPPDPPPGASCASPAPGVTGWVGGPLTGPVVCICATDGTVLNFFTGPGSTFAGSCFANGGSSAGLTFGGSCTCT